MLDYSGELLHGLRAMGLDDVFDSLKRITLDPAYRGSVEWLGTVWGHGVAPSTPAQDFRLHVRAWQHHFAALFGFDALACARGFSPPEMALPNHPDVAYEFVRTLKDCGFRWVMVQEHSVEVREQPGPDEAPVLGAHGTQAVRGGLSQARWLIFNLNHLGLTRALHSLSSQAVGKRSCHKTCFPSVTDFPTKAIRPPDMTRRRKPRWPRSMPTTDRF
jgi:hypothetical protein